MTAPRTTVRCPDKRFRTRRYAKRWAWGLEPDPSKRPVPVQCPDCTAWHLAAPDEDAPTTNDQEN